MKEWFTIDQIDTATYITVSYTHLDVYKRQILLYPFFQKYYMKGLTVGAVKG